VKHDIIMVLSTVASKTKNDDETIRATLNPD
jgi:hypothetical protein